MANRFIEILGEEGLTKADFAHLVDLKVSSVYDGTTRGHKAGAPRWVKAFVLGYELGRKKSDPSGGV